MKFGVIKLHSVLSGDDEIVEQEAQEFLANAKGEEDIEFVDPLPDGPNFFLIQTGGSEEFFVAVKDQYKPPYLIVPQGKRNSIAASLEIMSYLNRNGIPGELILDNVAQRLIDSQVSSHIEPAAVYGIIGEPSPWLISSKVDEEECLRRLNVRLERIPLSELYEAFENASDEPLEGYELEKLTENQNQLVRNYKLYHALKKIIVDHKLDGFTLRCFDLVQTQSLTSCLSYGLLMDEGYLCGCEGDVPALLTMHLFKQIVGKASFMANPERFEFDSNRILFAHCTCPISMCSSYVLDTHFESGLDFGIRGTMPLGTVTAAKISADLKEIRIMKGRALPHEFEDGICRTQIMVEFDQDIHDLFDNPFGNHVIFVFGDYAADLAGLAEKLHLIKR